MRAGVRRYRPDRAHDYLLCHPDDIAYTFTNTNRKFTKNGAREPVESGPGVFGGGLPNSEGVLWKRQRRLIQSLFQRERVATWEQIVVDRTLALLSEWRAGQTRQMTREMARLALDVFVPFVWRAESADEQHAQTTTIDTLVAATSHSSRLPLFVPTAGNLRLRRSMQHLDTVLYGAIQRRRADETHRDDLFSLLIAPAEDGMQLDDTQLRDELVLMLTSVYGATGSALGWIWQLLASHPGVEATLLAELGDVLAGQPPSGADLPRLSYTEAVVKEALRLYPPVWLTSRDASEDDLIRGYTVPAGTRLTLSPWVTHRDERFFPNPTVFQPNRWLDGSTTDVPKYAYFPFGGGPRLCIGASFAMLHLMLVVATIAPRFRLELPPGTVAIPQPRIVLWPAEGRMLLHAR